MIVWNDFRHDARVLKEAQTLTAAGYDVTVFALHTPGVTCAAEVLDGGVKVRRVLRNPFWPFPSVPALRKIRVTPFRRSLPGLILLVLSRIMTHLLIIVRVVCIRPNIIHSHDVNTLPTAWLSCVFARADLVYDAHEISTDREGYGKLRGLVWHVEKRLMPRAAATITTTESRAKHFAYAYGIKRPVVIQNRPRYQVPLKSDLLRRTCSLNEDWPVMIYQGGLQSGRGLERLVDAMCEVEAMYLVFVGGGRLEGALRRKVAQAGLEDRIRFIPTVDLDQLPAYTASADIGVHPLENTCLNHYTTDSNKLFEYMMAGLAVVISDMPEIRSIIDRFKFGVLVPPGDTDRLVQAIKTMRDNEGLRQACSNNALGASNLVSWEQQEHVLLSLYKEITHPASMRASA